MKIKPGAQHLIMMIFWAACLLVFILLLGGYAYRGIYSRYLQDDYCYSAQVQGRDFIAAQVDSYMNVMPYNSDRYALTLFSGFAGLLGGPGFDPFLPALSIVFWAAGLWLLIKEWQQAFQVKINWLAGLVGAFGLLFFVLYLEPNLYQVLFWRSAMFPYLTPLVIVTWLVAGFFYLLRAHRVRGWQALLFGLAAFIAGGFSETVAAWQVCLWGLLLIFFLFRSPRQRFTFGLVAIPLLGALLAILVMALGPGNTSQLSHFTHPDLASLVTQPLGYAWNFIHVALRVQTLPFAVIAGLGFLVGLRSEQATRLTFSSAVKILVVIGLMGYLAVLAEMLPTALAMSSPPGDRALLPAYFTLVSAVFVGGWTLARWLASYPLGERRRFVLQAAAVLLGLFLLGTTASTAPRVYGGLSASRQRAAAWDMRNALILEAKARGETHVVVPAFDSIAQIFELYPQENFWVNVCAAQYYGIEGISAVEGYNGVKPTFK